MRYNDRELARLGENKPALEGVLQHMKPQGNDWSDWYQQPSFKERYFKLVANLLFYYRVNEQEPLGVLVLENAQVAYERPHKGIPFAFSVTFKVNDRHKDNESKHIFSCRCDADVNKWVSALKMHSYEYWRSQYIILKTKISMKTGQDPVLDYMRNKVSALGFTEELTSITATKTTTTKSKSTFYSQVEATASSFFTSYTQNTQAKVQQKSNRNDDNLIDL